ncbi:MAG TPA: hypothetical protein VNS52_11085 [Gemmatimonadaceae bacterium]|nr:hypothetical protein [Gemmatimonadaceae bacterium]
MRITKRAALVAPSLLATVPALAIATGNAGEFTLQQLACTLAVLAAFGALVHGVAWCLLRRYGATRVAIVASAVVAWLCCSTLLTDHLGSIRPIVGSIVLGVAVVAACYRVLRHGADHEALARATGIFALAFVALGALRVASAALRVDRLYATSATVRDLTADLPAPRRSSRPDVYLIILDNLANARIQREVYGRSNRAFEDSLAALGFAIPAETRSNYAWTPLSVASLLNLGEIRGLEADLGPASHGFTVPYRLVQRNRAARWLHKAGYTVYLQPSIVFPGTLQLETPHVSYGPGGWRRFVEVYARNMLLRISLRQTLPIRFLERTQIVPPISRPRLDALLTVGDVAAAPGPKFVLAHSLLSHEPFVFSATCVPRSDGIEPGSDDRQAYVAAVSCTEKLVLAAVRRILRNSAQPPVIILQADHGPASLHPPVVGRAAEEITPEQARERMGAFGAYLFPGVPHEDIPATLTPVNVLRFVFSRYLGAPLAPLPDSSFYSSGERPNHFVNVTPFVAVPREAPLEVPLGAYTALR